MQAQLINFIHDNWQLSAKTQGAANLPANLHLKWVPAQVPGTVYSDLLRVNLIEDPNEDLQEQKVQWVAEQDWIYRTEFQVEDTESRSHTDLVLEGLDTYAEVWLNGHRIATSDNMFVPVRIDVHSLLQTGSNTLELRFASALREGRKLESLYGKRNLWNGDSSRLYVRKAQYHYGWDWGPVLLTAGPWRPVYLDQYDLRIQSVHSQYTLNVGKAQAQLRLQTRVIGNLSQAKDVQLTHSVYCPQGTCIAQWHGAAQPDCLAELECEQIKLWWPAGLGDQALYRVVTELSQGDRVLASEEKRIGFRQVRLVQEPVAGEAGTSFYFEVNGHSVFSGGANWIPDDNLLERISRERYYERVQQALDANMRMLRVWAGGIYESDDFYDACDELGVLVWQDFLFACGMYPAHDAFLSSVRHEAQAAIERLRHRPSLVIWCGNNEDYAVAESIGRYGAGKDMAQFDGRTIYEKLLPELCATLDPDRPYWPGSPYSPSATSILSSADQTVGDRHSWEVWHVQMAPYQDYHKFQARFVSEFGMQSHPSMELLEQTISPSERHHLSRTMQWHNKAGSGMPDGHRRLAVYQADTLRAGDDLASQVYASQFVQAEAMRYAYQDFRRRWQKPGARTVGGALVWQLNDCWPVTSWALIDSAGVVKPAWHTIRRALASLAVAIRNQDNKAVVWVMNETPSTHNLTITVQAYALHGQLVQEWQTPCTAQANAVSELTVDIGQHKTPVVLQVLLHTKNGERISSDAAWPEPYKFYDWGKQELVMDYSPSEKAVLLSTNQPTKGIWLSGTGMQFSDNFIDLMPKEAKVVHISGLADGAIRVQTLGSSGQKLNLRIAA